MQIDCQIERDIPLPMAEPKNFPGDVSNARKYPFRKMLIGESVFLPGVLTRRVSSCLYYYKRNYQMELSCRTVPGGCRVWRIN